MQIISKVAAAQATVNQFIFSDFEWGKNDCAHLVGFHLQQLGYDDPLEPIGTYKDFRSAVKAMKAGGIDSLPGFFDDRFERIAPAACVDGDIIALPADEGGSEWVALGICCGHGRVLAFVPHDTTAGARVTCRWSNPGGLAACVHAWRIPPRVVAQPVGDI